MDFASLGVEGIWAVMPPTHQACVAFCLDGDKQERGKERDGMSVVTNISMENVELEILLHIN